MEIINVEPFEITDKFARKLKLTKERIWAHISKRPEMLGKEELIKATLIDPDEVRESKEDSKALLYYRTNPKGDKWNRFILVIVKVLNGEGFILTSLFTGIIKEGKLVWKRN